MRVTSDTLFAHGGEMASRMAAKDWSATGIGPPSTWPQSLRAVVRVMLTSRYAMWMAWGPELTFFCNDAYLPTLGVKEVWALGSPARVVWEEIWPDIGPRIEGVLSTGEATWDEGLRLFLERSGYAEETYHTFSYSPLADDEGRISGMLCVVTEITSRMIGERRMSALHDLAAGLSVAGTEEEIFAAGAECLSRAARDFPFTLTCVFDEKGGSTRLAAYSGIDADCSLASEIIAPDSPWLPSKWTADGGIMDLAPHAGKVPCGPWPKPPSQALVLPFALSGESRYEGFLVAGLNPFRPLDGDYLNFAKLYAGQLEAALGKARRLETERKRAEALASLDQAKTAFFSNVSHEFRTPLTLMLGPLEEALSEVHGALPRRIAGELSVVHRNGLRLLKLVNSLLDFSRIEAGRMQAVFKPVDLAAWTLELAGVFRSAVEKAGMHLVVNCPSLDEPVFVDPGMWEKIVLNLISNAFKFTFEGRITVRLRRMGDFAELSVEDTGCGIQEGEIPRLFERFHRVEGARGRTHEGTGIGLALVQELVNLHGGTIRVKSSVGDGSLFTVSIPLGAAHLPPERVQLAAAGNETGITTRAYAMEALRWLPDGSGLPGGADTWTDDRAPASIAGIPFASTHGARIIIADDNPDMLQYENRLLSPYWKVESVRNGREALEAARREIPELIVSDIMMPHLDGMGLLGELRADERLKSVPILLLSARAGDEARMEALEAGADDYLVKPFSSRELLTRIGAHLQMARMRREAGESLRKSQVRVRLATEAAGLGVWIWEPSTNSSVWENERIYEIFGHPRSERPPDSSEFFNRYLHPDDRDAFMLEAAAAMRQGTRFFFQGRIRRADGGIRWAEFTGTLQPAMDGAPAYMLGSIADITEQKRLTGEREHLLDAERAARTEAERVGRLKDEFLAILSHELRTPLNAILGWTQILRMGTRDDKDINDGLDVIERNTKMQAGMIEDLLDMSRIISGKVTLDIQKVDLREVVASSVSSVSHSATAKDITLELSPDGPPAFVRGDPGRLQQCFWNLLSNAIKFTPKGGSVRVAIRRVDSNVEVSVEDSGQGIKPEFLSLIFEKFRQADASRTRQHGGLGLGLSIVKHLMDLHGGTISVASQGPGKGATFSAALPVMGACAPETVLPDDGGTGQASPVSGSEFSSLDGISVLVVDDEEDARHLLKRVLEECGAKVLAAGSAEEAYRILQNKPPDVILSDIGMPGEDGYEFIRRVRRLPAAQGGETPAAAVTAFARATDRVLALQAGYQTHVAKPVELAELTAVVASLFRRSGH